MHACLSTANIHHACDTPITLSLHLTLETETEEGLSIFFWLTNYSRTKEETMDTRIRKEQALQNPNQLRGPGQARI